MLVRPTSGLSSLCGNTWFPFKILSSSHESCVEHCWELRIFSCGAVWRLLAVNCNRAMFSYCLTASVSFSGAPVVGSLVNYSFVKTKSFRFHTSPQLCCTKVAKTTNRTNHDILLGNTSYIPEPCLGQLLVKSVWKSVVGDVDIVPTRTASLSSLDDKRTVDTVFHIGGNVQESHLFHQSTPAVMTHEHIQRVFSGSRHFLNSLKLIALQVSWKNISGKIVC